MRGERLLVRGLPVPEELPLVRPHLEEPEVLPVARGRRESRLAPGDGERLRRVAAEDDPDRDPRRGGREAASVPPRDDASVVRRLLRYPREPSNRARERSPCLGPALARAQQGATALEEADRAAEPARRCELAREDGLRRGRALLRRLRRPGLRCLGSARCRSGLCHENERTQANE